MKKIFPLIAITSLLVLFGCTKTIDTDTTVTPDEQPVAERQTYESKTDNFSIDYPGLREFEENVYGSNVMFFTPLSEGDQLRENIGIIKKELDKEYTLDDYYAITKPELESMITDFVEVSNDLITINNLDAKKLIYQGTQGETKLQREQIYLIKDNYVYIITYTATQDTFGEFTEQIDEMAATLKIN